VAAGTVLRWKLEQDDWESKCLRCCFVYRVIQRNSILGTLIPKKKNQEKNPRLYVSRKTFRMGKHSVFMHGSWFAGVKLQSCAYFDSSAGLAIYGNCRSSRFKENLSTFWLF
jgi:hypothetical protein